MSVLMYRIQEKPPATGVPAHPEIMRRSLDSYGSQNVFISLSYVKEDYFTDALVSAFQPFFAQWLKGQDLTCWSPIWIHLSSHSVVVKPQSKELSCMCVSQSILQPLNHSSSDHLTNQPIELTVQTYHVNQLYKPPLPYERPHKPTLPYEPTSQTDLT